MLLPLGLKLISINNGPKYQDGDVLVLLRVRSTLSLSGDRLTEVMLIPVVRLCYLQHLNSFDRATGGLS